jgi:hypothetical protein
MPRSRPPYPPDFRGQLVAFHLASRTIEELAREVEPSKESTCTRSTEPGQLQRATVPCRQTPSADPQSRLQRVP